MTMKKNSLVLAICIIVLELIGGMQTYLTQLILPIMAADLDAQDMYGVITGVGSISTMVGLPIGAALLQRCRLPRLLLTATFVLIIGAIISATAVNIWIFLIGRAISGLAGACLAMASIGAVAVGLTGRARQLTLAFNSASWVVASIVGPSYAAWVTNLLSWRWAMLCYLPFLLAARIIIAENLDSNQHPDDSPMPLKATGLIAIGIILMIVPVPSPWKYVLMVSGFLILGWVAIISMPPHTFTTGGIRLHALAGLFFLTGAYYSANELVTLSYHDLFSGSAKDLGYIILGGGLGWSVTGVLAGLKPAKNPRHYLIRIGTGVGLIITASTLITVALATRMAGLPPHPTMVVLWTSAGIGMGIVYLDVLNTLFEDPAIPDGIPIETIAASSVIVENLASAMFIPLLSSLVAVAFPQHGTSTTITPPTWPYVLSWGLVAVLAVIALSYLIRSGHSEKAAWLAKPAEADQSDRAAQAQPSVR